jgi:hypothetical protein
VPSSFGALTFPIPVHATYVVAQPVEGILHGFVAFFGMHYLGGVAVAPTQRG